jgi:hypoxanthine phosphoribosyltransferase
VKELGQSIFRDYDGCNPVLVGVLNGVLPLMAALQPVITIPLEVDFMVLSSSRNEDEQGVAVRLENDLCRPTTGRHVLFVEDVIDTGLSLNYLLRILRARNPVTLKVCSLFNKRRRR